MSMSALEVSCFQCVLVKSLTHDPRVRSQRGRTSISRCLRAPGACAMLAPVALDRASTPGLQSPAARCERAWLSWASAFRTNVYSNRLSLHRDFAQVLRCLQTDDLVIKKQRCSSERTTDRCRLDGLLGGFVDFEELSHSKLRG